MFVFLSKLLPLILYPIGLTCLLLAAALLIKRNRWQRAATGAALALLVVGGNHWVAQALARSLEWRYLPSAEMPRASVIVVLSGGTEPAQYPRLFTEVNSAGDRVIYAARLYRVGAAPRILLTGGSIDWLGARASSPAEEMAELLNLLNVPESALILETESRNTYENALFTRQILEKEGVNRIILVTSALHMPRSVALFEKQGFDVIPAPADYSITQEANEETGTDFTWSDIPGWLVNLIPSAGNLATTTNVLKEYLGMLIYRLQGWM